MASSILYPPILESTLPAFVYSKNLEIPITLSSFSSSLKNDIKSVHISIKEVISGASVIKTDAEFIADSDYKESRYYDTGIIIYNIDAAARFASSDSFKVVITSNEAEFQTETLYAIQVRVSTSAYNPAESSMGQSAWLRENALTFSEWSIVCRTKCIAEPFINIENFGEQIAGSGEVTDIYTISESTLNFEAIYSNYYTKDGNSQRIEVKGEDLYSYKLRLFNSDADVQQDKPIEESNDIIASDNTMKYLFKHILEDGKGYILALTYTTKNYYTGTVIVNFDVLLSLVDKTDIYAVTLDNADYLTTLGLADSDLFINNLNKITSYESERECGRIGIKLFQEVGTSYSGNICIKRADSKDNFRTWTERFIYPCISSVVNNIPIFYDYFIESGVFYKYAVCKIESNGDRGILNPEHHAVIKPSLREFEFSYLIGENGRQLKLKYDGATGNYIYNRTDTKTDTIGSEYPFITRTSKIKYRTFPISGLISFNMDIENLFTSELEIHNENVEVAELYQDRRDKEHILLYDYKREMDFREKVLEFLYDGKPKLFKSPTEENIIIRLMGVSAQPNQSLNRMIYTFSATAHEIAEYNYENCIKYKFFNLSDIERDFKKVETKLGQLDIDVTVGDNLIKKIWDKYDMSQYNILGERITLERIKYLTLTFTDKPLKLNVNGHLVLGNKFIFNGDTFIVHAGYSRMYMFDTEMDITAEDVLYIFGDADGEISTVHVMVDFLYERSRQPYVENQIKTRTTHKGVGQFFETCEPGTNIYKKLYYKYHYDWDKDFSNLSQLFWTGIEANPGTIFRLKDGFDRTGELHEIGGTGLLNLEGIGDIVNIEYVGVRCADGSIAEINADVMIDYAYNLVRGTYE